jgi:hypothetical protein
LRELREGFEKEEESLQAKEVAFAQKEIISYRTYLIAPIFPEDTIRFRDKKTGATAHQIITLPAPYLCIYAKYSKSKSGKESLLSGRFFVIISGRARKS